ncbi:DUF402 domain-containing protein [bacterium]|nr:DUF402 domain-containing protein [bacterium]
MACVERKKLLWGDEKRYVCDLVSHEPGFCLLKYILDKPVRVGSLALEAGTITYGFYWSDRPYTLYKWISPANTEVGNYFNVASEVSISRTEVAWRDLVLDILIKHDGCVEILDETELADLKDENMRREIEQGKKAILRDYQEVIESTSVILREWIQPV